MENLCNSYGRICKKSIHYMYIQSMEILKNSIKCMVYTLWRKDTIYGKKGTLYGVLHKVYAKIL